MTIVNFPNETVWATAVSKKKEYVDAEWLKSKTDFLNSEIDKRKAEGYSDCHLTNRDSDDGVKTYMIAYCLKCPAEFTKKKHPGMEGKDAYDWPWGFHSQNNVVWYQCVPPPTKSAAKVASMIIHSPANPEEATEVTVSTTIKNTGEKGGIWAEFRDEAGNLRNGWTAELDKDATHELTATYSQPPGDFTMIAICGHIEDSTHQEDDRVSKTIATYYPPPQPPPVPPPQPPPDEPPPEKSWMQKLIDAIVDFFKDPTIIFDWLGWDALNSAIYDETGKIMTEEDLPELKKHPGAIRFLSILFTGKDLRGEPVSVPDLVDALDFSLLFTALGWHLDAIGPMGNKLTGSYTVKYADEGFELITKNNPVKAGKLTKIFGKGTALWKIVGILSAVGFTDSMIVWLASDNIITQATMYVQDLAKNVKAGTITKEKAFEELALSQAWLDKAKSFIDISTAVNPLLMLFKSTIDTNVEAAQAKLNKEFEDITAAIPGETPPEFPPEEMVNLTLSTTPEGAKIYINGVYQYAETTTTILVDPVTQTITLKLSGYEDKSFDITAVTGEPMSFDFVLVKKPPAPPPPKAKLVIKSDPTGAKIYMNDVYTFETTDTTIDIEPGTHKINLKLIDYEDAEQEIDVAADEIKDITFALVPKLVPPPPEKGKLTILSEPINAKVYLNDTFLFEYTNTTINVEPGTHKITLKLEGYEDAEKTVEIAAGEEKELRIPLFEKPAPPPVPTENPVLITTGAVEGAKVYIDGKYTFLTTPVTISFTFEDHIIRLEKDGYNPFETTLTSEQVEAGAADFLLTPTEQPPTTPSVPSVPITPIIPPLLPPAIIPEPMPAAPAPAEKSLVLDIETTGDEPWNSRIICIGFKDATMPGISSVCIMKETEKEMLQDFLKIIREGGFRELIGYHIGFDFRYILTKCMFYRLVAKELYDCELTDVMQIVTQIKSKFVYGYRKSGKLNDWMKFLLKKEKPIDYKELLKAYVEGKLEKIREYNLNDVDSTFEIWSLAEYVFKTEYSEETTAIETPAAKPVKRKCPRCMQELEIPAGMTEFKCPVCGEDVLAS